ncbi:DMT family transporter [Pseudomonas canadensis]|uniref:DMT family transporter n=1 Tax=Pseudomonas canadensis TaxID=915099 RepID=UPI003B9E52B1
MRSLTVLILAVMVSITWGTTWMAMKIAVETIPPVFATGLRFVFAAPFLICIAWITKAPLLFPPGQRIFQLGICIFYFAIPFSLMIYGETHIGSGLASIIFANMPVAILIASMILLKNRTNAVQIIGLAMSTTSLVVILFNESKTTVGPHWPGILALVAAVIIHAITYAQCKKISCDVSVITFNALPCLCAGLMLSIVGWVAESPRISGISKISILSTLYLGVFAGVFGILCYFSLQKRASPFQASLVFLIFPLVAVSLESYVYGNSLALNSIYMTIPLAVGILITLFSQHLYCDNKTKKLPCDGP